MCCCFPFTDICHLFDGYRLLVILAVAVVAVACSCRYWGSHLSAALSLKERYWTLQVLRQTRRPCSRWSYTTARLSCWPYTSSRHQSPRGDVTWRQNTMTSQKYVRGDRSRDYPDTCPDRRAGLRSIVSSYAACGHPAAATSFERNRATRQIKKACGEGARRVDVHSKITQYRPPGNRC